MKPELLFNAHDAFEHILSVKFPSFEHVGSPPATDKFLDDITVTIELPGRNVGVPGADESWMDGLSAAEVIRQYGIVPNVILTPEGKFETPSREHISLKPWKVLTTHPVWMRVHRIHIKVVKGLPTKRSC